MESKEFTHIIIIHKDKNMGKGVNNFIKWKEELLPRRPIHCHSSSLGSVVVNNNPPLCLILAIISSKGGPLTKIPKIFLSKFLYFKSLKAISHRRERVKSFPMRINKLERSDAKFIALHILKAPLKENEKESPTADMRHRISQTSQKLHTTSK